MKRSRSTPLATLSTLSPTRTTEPIELLKHMGSPKRTYVGNCINIGPGRRIPKGRKHADVQERKHHGELAFGQVDPEVVAAQLAAKKKRTEQEALDKLPKPLEIYNRRALYPEWLLKDERFDRIFKMPMMPEFVAIRKDPLRRHDDDKTALTKWLGTHSLFTHFSTFKRRALGNITRLHKFTTGDIICSHGATRHKFYIVINGKVNISSPALGPLGTIGVGDSVGHVESHAVMESFHENNKREYDIVLKAASKETHIAVILRSAYRDAMHEFEDAEMWENIRFMRKDVSLFRNWSKSRLMLMAKSLETWNVEKGEIIVQQSRASDFMFFVVEGECAVQKRIHFSRDNKIPTGVTGVFDIVKSETNMDVEIHIAKSGDFFGHHSFLTQEAVEQRRAEIEANKQRSKGTQKIRSKMGSNGGGGGGGSGSSGLGGLFQNSKNGLLSGLSASVASLQLLEKEKKENNMLPRSATVVARTHCKLLALSLDNFWDMMTYGDTIDQLMAHIRHFKTQAEVIRGFDEHKRLKKIWENAKDAVQNCGQSLGGVMDFETAVPRPMKITVAGESFRSRGEIMGGHFDVPAAISRRRKQKSRILAKLKKSAKMGSFLARLSKNNNNTGGGLASLFGGKKKGGGLASLFGDAMTANNLKKNQRPDSKRKKKKRKGNAKDKRYNKKQASKRRDALIESSKLKESKDKLADYNGHKEKAKRGGRIGGGTGNTQMGKSSEHHQFHMPGTGSKKVFDTRQEFADGNEWKAMMDKEKEKHKKSKKK